MITNVDTQHHDISVPLRVATTSYDRDGVHYNSFALMDTSTDCQMTSACVSMKIVDNELVREYEIDGAEVTPIQYALWMKVFDVLRYTNYNYEKRLSHV